MELDFYFDGLILSVCFFIYLIFAVHIVFFDESRGSYLSMEFIEQLFDRLEEEYIYFLLYNLEYKECSPFLFIYNAQVGSFFSILERVSGFILFISWLVFVLFFCDFSYFMGYFYYFIMNLIFNIYFIMNFLILLVILFLIYHIVKGVLSIIED